MNFTFLEIEVTTLLAYYLIVAIIVLVIFYYVIKAAVKYGILEAKEIQDKQADKAKGILTPTQIELQKRYERGELTIEQYNGELEKSK